MSPLAKTKNDIFSYAALFTTQRFERSILNPVHRTYAPRRPLFFFSLYFPIIKKNGFTIRVFLDPAHRRVRHRVAVRRSCRGHCARHTFHTGLQDEQSSGLSFSPRTSVAYRSARCVGSCRRRIRVHYRDPFRSCNAHGCPAHRFGVHCSLGQRYECHVPLEPSVSLRHVRRGWRFRFLVVDVEAWWPSTQHLCVSGRYDLGIAQTAEANRGARHLPQHHAQQLALH